jgi:hypothetical protein
MRHSSSNVTVLMTDKGTHHHEPEKPSASRIR